VVLSLKITFCLHILDISSSYRWFRLLPGLERVFEELNRYFEKGATGSSCNMQKKCSGATGTPIAAFFSANDTTLSFCNG
jgi:hypothetical protein